MKRLNYILTAIGTVILLFSAGCGSNAVTPEKDDDILVTVGDSTLMVSDVLKRIPSGMNPEDSAALFNRIVETWVQDLVLSEFAEKNIPDLERIERMTEAYRRDLIVNSYLQSMTERSVTDIGEERIRRYYEDNKESMVLEQPIVKGAFLKVSENDESLDDLRSWMREFSEKSIDKIEKAGLRHASQYKYFKEEWNEWSSIAEQIPYRFFDADAFVTSTKNFETSDQGSVYLLHISEYVPSGKEMPYEFAREKIIEILQNTDKADYSDRLLKDIYRNQIEEGLLKPGTYDPVKREYTNSKNGNKNSVR